MGRRIVKNVNIWRLALRPLLTGFFIGTVLGKALDLLPPRTALVAIALLLVPLAAYLIHIHLQLRKASRELEKAILTWRQGVSGLDTRGRIWGALLEMVLNEVRPLPLSLRGVTLWR